MSLTLPVVAVLLLALVAKRADVAKEDLEVPGVYGPRDRATEVVGRDADRAVQGHRQGCAGTPTGLCSDTDRAVLRRRCLSEGPSGGRSAAQCLWKVLDSSIRFQMGLTEDQRYRRIVEALWGGG